MTPLTKNIDIKTNTGATAVIKGFILKEDNLLFIIIQFIVCESSHSNNKGKTDILGFILNVGASIDIQDEEGATALMHCMMLFIYLLIFYSQFSIF